MPEEIVRFTKDENGVITDAITRKKWLVALTTESTWDEAQTTIAALAVDGGGWRAATAEEHKEIFETGKGTRNIDPLFVVTGTRFWAEEVDTDKAKVFICCTRSKDWRFKSYKKNTNTLAVKDPS